MHQEILQNAPGEIAKTPSRDAPSSKPDSDRTAAVSNVPSAAASRAREKSKIPPLAPLSPPTPLPPLPLSAAPKPSLFSVDGARPRLPPAAFSAAHPLSSLPPPTAAFPLPPSLFPPPACCVRLLRLSLPLSSLSLLLSSLPPAASASPTPSAQRPPPARCPRRPLSLSPTRTALCSSCSFVASTGDVSSAGVFSSTDNSIPPSPAPTSHRLLQRRRLHRTSKYPSSPSLSSIYPPTSPSCCLRLAPLPSLSAFPLPPSLPSPSRPLPYIGI